MADAANVMRRDDDDGAGPAPTPEQREVQGGRARGERQRTCDADALGDLGLERVDLGPEGATQPDRTASRTNASSTSVTSALDR